MEDTQVLKTVAVIVAHPDDETLWAGGTILRHPNWKCFIVCVCRGSDTDRAIRFKEMLKVVGAEGVMGDLDDGPEQNPLDSLVLEKTILELLPPIPYDLIISHHVTGEYTKHLRHEEVNRAVINLWHRGELKTKELWTFAYSDSNKAHMPKAVKYAPIHLTLNSSIWMQKYNLITKIYGFEKGSWEEETTPRSEAFWQYKNPKAAMESIEYFRNDIKMSKFLIFKNLLQKHI